MRSRCCSGGCTAAVPARGKPHLLHRLAVELEDHRRRREPEALVDRPLDVVAVGVPEVAHVRRQVVHVEAAVGDVLLELPRVGRAAAELAAVRAAIAGQRADAGPPLVIDDVVGIAAGKLRASRPPSPCPAARDARRDRSARPGTAAHRGRASRPAGGWHRPARPAPRSAGPAARCNPSAPDRSCRAAPGRHRRPSRRHRRPNR